MIRAGVNDPGDYQILIGLSEENVKRLRQGRPIYTTLRSFGLDLPGNVTVLYGKTEADIEAFLRRAGVIGPKTVKGTPPETPTGAEDTPTFGATGEFPEGKYREDDKGGLLAGVAADVEGKRVVVEFGTPTTWIAMLPEQAVAFGETLLAKALQVQDSSPKEGT